MDIGSRPHTHMDWEHLFCIFIFSPINLAPKIDRVSVKRSATIKCWRRNEIKWKKEDIVYGSLAILFLPFDWTPFFALLFGSDKNTHGDCFHQRLYFLLFLLTLFIFISSCDNLQANACKRFGTSKISGLTKMCLKPLWLRTGSNANAYLNNV